MRQSKILVTFLMVGLLLIGVQSCQKTSTGTAFTNTTMKPWFDDNCASCHASGKKNADEWLYNASNYESSIKSEISSIYSEVYTRRSMPEGYSLSTDELNKFKTWYDDGYPSN